MDMFPAGYRTRGINRQSKRSLDYLWQIRARVLERV